MVSLLGSDVPEVDIDELARQHGDGLVLIDVRRRYEYEAGHVPGAVLMPLDEVMSRLDELPSEGPVYVICETGVRSQKAALFFRSRGIDAHNVAGGTKAWIDSNRPVVYGTEPVAPDPEGS